MEWAPSTAMHHRSGSPESSSYIGSAGRTREADLCFKVRCVRAGFFTNTGLTTTEVQPNWSLDVRLLFLRAHIKRVSHPHVQNAQTLLARASRSARRVPHRGVRVRLAAVTSAAKKVTGPTVCYSLSISCTTGVDHRVACPNPDGGTSKPKSRTATRTTSTSKRGAKTTRSTSGSSTRGGKGTRGKKAASKFAAADDW
jgi:hypothetical protein